MKQRDVFKLVDETLLTEKLLRNDKHVQYVQETGIDNSQYRELAKLPAVNRERQQRHNAFVHQLGVDILQAMVSEAKENQLERERALKKQSKVGSLLRKRVKVTDYADGGIAISIEQDWDTSTWTDSLVEAGSEALLYVFYDLRDVSSLERKEKALQMLQKLIQRHPAADVFLRKNLEMLIGKATSRLIRNGASCGVLNLLFVLNGCKEIFVKELSNYKFNGRVVDMLLVEAKLAAILIQHTVRARRAKQALKLNRNTVADASVRASLLKAAEFGTDKEEYYRRLRVINARSSDLRRFWRLMHGTEKLSTQGGTSTQPAIQFNRRLVGGIRGPVHLDPFHVHTALQAAAYLVSDATGAFAHGNREDVVRAQGCILLSTMLGCPTSPFVFLAAKALAEISKASESFTHVINAGIVHSAFRYMKHTRTVHKIGMKIIRKPQQAPRLGATGETQMLLGFLDCFDIVINTAQHAAGLFRALQGYDFIKPAHGTVEATNYHLLLAHLHGAKLIYNLSDFLHRPLADAHRRHVLNYKDNPPITRPPRVLSVDGVPVATKEKMLQEITALLANSYLLEELGTILLQVPQHSLLKRTLRCLLSLLSSHAHARIVEELTGQGAKLLIRLLELLAHDDLEVALLAVMVFTQLNTAHTSRQALLVVNVSKYLIDFQQRQVQRYAALGPYSYVADAVLERSLMVTATLCRQFDWRLFDSQRLHEEVQLEGVAAAAAAGRAGQHQRDSRDQPPELGFVKRRLYLDLLITMKIGYIRNSDEGSSGDRDRSGAGYPVRAGSIGGGSGTGAGTHSAGTFQDDVDSLLRSVHNDNVHSWTISDWIVIPSTYSLCLQMSQQLSVLSPQWLTNYFLNPESLYHYEHLPLHESVAVCQIIEGVCAYHQTARLIYNPSVVLFLIKFVYLNKFIFLGKPLDPMQVRILLSGIKSAFIALGRLCMAIKETFVPAEEFIGTLQANEFLANAIFFLDSLSVFSHTLPFNVLQIQKEVGVVVLEFFAKYAALLNHMQYTKRSAVARISDLSPVGKLTVELLHKLHGNYEVYLTHHPEHRASLHEEEIHIHDKMCSLLCAICAHKEAAYWALSDWRVGAALRRYVPPPLSGLPDVSHGGKFRSFIRTSSSNLSPDMITGDSPRKRGSFTSSLRVKNRTQELRSPMHQLFRVAELVEDNFVDDLIAGGGTEAHRDYALELLELPASFFELCALLGQIDTGLAFCMTSGFLRRAMDKMVILHFQMERAREIYPRQFLQTIKWEDRKYDFAGCFRLITSMANYHHPEDGNANDMILSPLFHVVEIARDVLGLRIKRWEDVVLAAYECLAELARDAFRVSQLFEQYDILSIVQRELYHLDQLPLQAARAAVQVVHHSCSGLTSRYIVRTMPLLREALGKVSRVFPELDEDVRRAHWTLTKSGMIYKTTVDASFHVDGINDAERLAQLHVEIEEYIRTGHLPDVVDSKAAVEYIREKHPLGRAEGGGGSGPKRRAGSTYGSFSALGGIDGGGEDSLDDLKRNKFKKAVVYTDEAPAQDPSMAARLKQANGAMLVRRASISTLPAAELKDEDLSRKTFASRFLEQLQIQPLPMPSEGSQGSGRSSGRKSGRRKVSTPPRSPSSSRSVKLGNGRYAYHDDSTATMLNKTAEVLRKAGSPTAAAAGGAQSPHEQAHPHLHQDELGHYSHCGVSTCGSLRFPHISSAPATPFDKDQQVRDVMEYTLHDTRSAMKMADTITSPIDLTSEHGVFAPISPDLADRLALSLKFPEEAASVLPISQLSAREPGLRELIAMRKGKAGFAEVQKVRLRPGSSGHGETSKMAKKRERRAKPAETAASLPQLSVEEMPDLRFTRPPPK